MSGPGQAGHYGIQGARARCKALPRVSVSGAAPPGAETVSRQPCISVEHRVGLLTDGARRGASHLTSPFNGSG
jgi:hypothetical protein